MYGTNSPGLVIQGYIHKIGIITESKVLLIVLFSLLVTDNHHNLSFVAGKGVQG